MGQDFTATYLDISKYFEKIWHRGLLFKCEHAFGISGRLLEWLTSYLKDRKQRVKIANTFSTTLIINSGCPQGSALGPLLALMYLNQLSSQIQEDILLFADDTSIYASYKKGKFHAAQVSLQSDLNKIFEYGQNVL